ncbi:tRNA glutamyl-Q(34) synthetase GluQRS [Silvanigrella aquatica]|uniref:Glutamyl-Q tRNA(Asp) synthetase n=1 Tax=Silvanigrella aquatica TaxID=1915309 RepID=A0A1L4D471_9BACT|nr:tRNA glutamyl-Q(34) synthetase GluQRS [Silvanigrella aquatica]APJ05014.1 tRNA glutamyl-Q(34) synthetase GluQRS [Silvanigrella aquatica]
MQKYSDYIGRFAPSPTGDLHMGSLITALASYLRARSQNGKWLLRIEDVDTTRAQKNSIISILKTLESHGLYWDDEIIYQSQRNKIYSEYLQLLKEKKLLYKCICSRKKLSQCEKNPVTYEAIYPGFCKYLSNEKMAQYSIRITIHDDNKISFTDLIQGKHEQDISKEVGDFILWRNENIATYQLAVVVDDELQGVTEVVRGSDLLWQTPRQIYLQKRLNFKTPQYLHIPIATNEKNQKLSKQTKAKQLKNEEAVENILQALIFLGFNNDIIQKAKDLNFSPFDLINYAIPLFGYLKIPKKMEIITQY